MRKVMEFDFIPDAKQEIGTEDPWYALNNGYLNPEEVLADERQLEALQNAIELINDFIEQCFDEGIIEDS